MFRLFASIVIVLALALPSVSCSKSSPTGPSDPAPAPAVFRFSTIDYLRDEAVKYPQNLNAQGNRLMIVKRGSSASDWRGFYDCWRVHMTVAEDFSKYSCALQSLEFTQGDYAVYFQDPAIGINAHRVFVLNGQVIVRTVDVSTLVGTSIMGLFTVTSDGRVQ